ncbi:hypothetical protein EDB84DRAFT_1533385 [Lactarius hengduanensis]|nr:hypothetical protein EDB84DRAFT_1533385 [Lactarius hengduanensis]
MAVASLDINFKEELSFVEPSFKVLSEAEALLPLFTVFYNIPLKYRSAFSSPSCNI